MTTTTIDPTSEPLGVGEPREKRHWRFGFNSLRQRWQRRRLRKRVSGRLLRRLIKRADLDEAQLDKLLRAQQQISRLRGTVAHQQRELRWSLLGVVLDPQQGPTQAMSDVRLVSRRFDEQSAELIMSLAAFGSSLNGEQRANFKRWLARS